MTPVEEKCELCEDKVGGYSYDSFLANKAKHMQDKHSKPATITFEHVEKLLTRPNQKVEGDINNDGKFDKSDLTLAAKTLAKGVSSVFKKKKK